MHAQATRSGPGSALCQRSCWKRVPRSLLPSWASGVTGCHGWAASTSTSIAPLPNDFWPKEPKQTVSCSADQVGMDRTRLVWLHRRHERLLHKSVPCVPAGATSRATARRSHRCGPPRSQGCNHTHQGASKIWCRPTQGPRTPADDLTRPSGNGHTIQSVSSSLLASRTFVMHP